MAWGDVGANRVDGTVALGDCSADGDYDKAHKGDEGGEGLHDFWILGPQIDRLSRMEGSQYCGRWWDW